MEEPWVQSGAAFPAWGRVGTGLIPTLGSNFGSLTWPDSVCQSCEQRPWSQAFLPSPFNCNQGGGGLVAAPTPKGSWRRFVVVPDGAGAREGQEQCQVQTHPGIENPSPPAEGCGTRQLTLLSVGILLKKPEPSEVPCCCGTLQKGHMRGPCSATDRGSEGS